jgi:hypothetical protein
MRDAIEDAQTTTGPMQLTAENGQDVKTYTVDYHVGLRYPHLVRDESKQDFLGEILKSLAP